MAEPGWADIQATNAMASVILESLGYAVKVDNLSVPITFKALETRKIDVFLGNWMPAQQSMVDAGIKGGGLQVLQTNLPQAKFTLAVPKYVADAGVRSFADLQRHAQAFGTRIYGIEAGAPANQNIRRMLDSGQFGLKGWKLVESSEAGMLSQVARSVGTQSWIVFLAWEPHMMNTKFPLTYLSGGDEYFGPNFGSASVRTVSRAGYSKECANLGKLFTNMVFNVDLENRVIADVLDAKLDARTAARMALQRSPDVLDAWLAGVTTATGSPDARGAVQRWLEAKH